MEFFINFIDFLFRWAHLLVGITWIGMLYYFNFVQGGYFKQASPEGLADAKAKLAPSALWWFRWGAMMTFLTGVVLLVGMSHKNQINNSIVVGATMGTIMFLNVWLVIWPAQQIALGMKEGDGPANAARALLASRTNTLFSAPMAFGMLASSHASSWGGSGYGTSVGGTDLIIVLVIVALLEANALFGKLWLLESVKGVIHSSIALTVVLFGILYCL